MHFIEDSYRELASSMGQSLHTSKRMHFIEEQIGSWPCGVVSSLHTSKRMHFIEDKKLIEAYRVGRVLAYVKTYALH